MSKIYCCNRNNIKKIDTPWTLRLFRRIIICWTQMLLSRNPSLISKWKVKMMIFSIRLKNFKTILKVKRVVTRLKENNEKREMEVSIKLLAATSKSLRLLNFLIDLLTQEKIVLAIHQVSAQSSISNLWVQQNQLQSRGSFQLERKITLVMS